MKIRLSYKILTIFLVGMILPLVLTSHYILDTVDASAQSEVQKRLARAGLATEQLLSEARARLSVELKKFIANPVFFEQNPDNFASSSALLAKEFFTRTELQKFIMIEGDTTVVSIESETKKAWGPFSKEMIDRARKGELVVIFSYDGTFSIDGAVSVKAYEKEPVCVLVRKTISQNFLDPLRDLTGVELTLALQNQRIISTMLDIDSHRRTHEEIPPFFSSKDIDSTGILGDEQYLSQPYITFAKKILKGEQNPIILLCSIPRSTMGNLKGILGRYLNIILFASLVVTIFSGWVLSLHIIRPILKLSSMAELMAQGNLDQVSALSRSDEIGTLSRSFDEMSAKLARKLFEMKTLYDVSNQMNFMNNRDQVLNCILDHTLKALNAERGSIMLYSPKLGGLIVELVKARDTIDLADFSGDEPPKRRLIPPGEGIAGRVFSQMKSIISNDIANDERFAKEQSESNPSQNVKSLICVPLIAQDQPIGVLNVTNKKAGHCFSHEDQSLLEMLAAQAAVTIENAKLYELSITDGLTRLFIHRYFQIRLEEEIIRAIRYQSCVSLVMFDIDHFKKFNDTYGHQTGDQVLIKVAKLVGDVTRRNIDIPCRYGGEEFTIILPETNGEYAFYFAERLRKHIESAGFDGPNKQQLKVTISVGVASCPFHSEEKEILIKMADDSLYQCKQRGRNCVTLYPGPCGTAESKQSK